MRNFQPREILVFLALAKMSGFQNRRPSYRECEEAGIRVEATVVQRFRVVP
jgi:hypothetical protein